MKRYEVLLQEGEMARLMLFITKGLLRTFRRDEKGKESILKFSSELGFGFNLRLYVCKFKVQIWFVNRYQKSKCLVIDSAL